MLSINTNSTTNFNDSPLPKGNFISAVRESCRASVASLTEPNVKIDEEGIREFLKSIDTEAWKRYSRQGASVGLPLIFDNIEDEVNVFALIDLLNFGSGYRKELHASLKRGAFETMQFGVIAMYISNSKVDAKYMKSFTVFDASQLFGLPITREVPHPTIPIVRTMEDTELRPLADAIVHILNETGTILEQGGYKNLGQFVLATTRGGDCTAANLAEKLVRAFPAFRDIGSFNNDQPTYIFKKAQLLCANLYRRFKNNKSSPFAFPDISNLTIFSDNVVPSMLIHHSVIKIPEALQTKIANEVPLTFEEVTKLRAAAIVACEAIRESASTGGDDLLKSMTEIELDFFLWRVAKEDALRNGVKRVVYKDTVFF